MDFAIVGGAAFDGEAAGAHGGEEGFDSVDAIPEEVGVGGFEGGGTAGVCGDDFADAALAHGLGVFAEAKGGGGEDGRVGFGGGVEDADGVGEGASDGFVDEGGFAGFEAGEDLFEVRSAVVGLEEDDIDLVEEVGDGGDDFDALVFDLLGEFGDAFGAGLDVFAALGVSGDDADAHEFGGLRGFGVEEFGERDGVGGIEADDAGADVLGLSEGGGERGGDEGDEEGTEHD